LAFRVLRNRTWVDDRFLCRSGSQEGYGHPRACYANTARTGPADADSHDSGLREKPHPVNFSPRHHRPRIVFISLRLRASRHFRARTRGASRPCAPSGGEPSGPAYTLLR
jgi:hypothetical protein